MISIINPTKDLVANRARSLTLYEIAKQCECSEAWLKKFLHGHIKNPSATKIERIYNFMIAYNKQGRVGELNL